MSNIVGGDNSASYRDCAGAILLERENTILPFIGTVWEQYCWWGKHNSASDRDCKGAILFVCGLD